MVDAAPNNLGSKEIHSTLKKRWTSILGIRHPLCAYIELT